MNRQHSSLCGVLAKIAQSEPPTNEARVTFLGMVATNYLPSISGRRWEMSFTIQGPEKNMG